MRNFILYNILLTYAVIISFPIFIPSLLLLRKRRKTVLQRLGLKGLPENINRIKKPIWVHALSVGEVISAVALVKKLKSCFKNKQIVFSVSTATGFEMAVKLLKKHVNAVFFFPFDFAFSVKRIARKIDPAFVIIVETDIWHNFLFEMKKRNVPVALVNARLSKRSFVGYKHFSFFAKSLFSCFSKICAQSVNDANRFKLLGVPSSKIIVTGNIKFDQEHVPVSEKEIKKLKKNFHLQTFDKILLAGSVHKGEEAIILDSFAKIKKEFNEFALILVPRNPEHSESMRGVFQFAGFSSVCMTEINKHPQNKKFDVIIVDVIGILRELYAVADIAFVGGSLVNCGGHNPIEPAAHSKPIIFGRYINDFAQISEMLVKSGGALQVCDAKSLFEAIKMLAQDGDKATQIGKQAMKVFCSNKGAIDKTLMAIQKW